MSPTTEIPLGYCTNVHAGNSLEQARRNLERHALAVKGRFASDRDMGVGLWLAASAAARLRDARLRAEFGGWLADQGLIPFTLNGFPYGDFHREVVKHDVYLPTWWEQERLDYTLDLIDILHSLLPPGMEGAISTLPIAWGQPAAEREKLRQAAALLHQAAHRLARLEADAGRRITLCLEPEPGCILQTSADLVRFFHEHLFVPGHEETARTYLAVCHDVCHAAVMFEDQVEVLERYRRAGIAIGKVQISSAVRVALDELPRDDRRAALNQLAEFAEDRYLHQTMVRAKSDEAPLFFEDLPAALASHPARQARGEWRIHFHVPIYLARFGRLEATQQAIRDCLAHVKGHGLCRHLEVETYAWGVLPPELRQEDLAAGIAEEMRWARDLLQRL